LKKNSPEHYFWYSAMDEEPQERLWKVVCMGAAGAGKTAFVKRLVYSIFSAHYKPTVSINGGEVEGSV
jgi:GTPase SAR1 family protein